MRKIDEIIRVEQKIDKDKKIYYTTHAIAGGDEVRGWSRKRNEYQVGDEVMVYHHDQYDITKMEKKS